MLNLSFRRIKAIARTDISILAGSMNIGSRKSKALNASKGRGAMVGFALLMFFVGLSYTVPSIFAMTAQYQVLGDNVVFTLMKNIYLLGTFFGFSLVYAAFFSGEDVERFLSLPVHAAELIIGKFTATTVFIGIIFGLYSLPGFITFGVINGSGPLFYILLPVIIILSAGLLTAIFGTLNLLIAGFASLFKHARKAVAYGLSALTGLVLLVYYMTSSASMYIEQSPSSNPIFRYAEYLLMGYGPAKILSGESLVELGLFFLNFILFTAVFAIIGQFLYIRGLAGISAAMAKKSKLKSGELLHSAGGGNARISYLAKEARMLIRSPMVAMNCLVGGIIFPVMIIGALVYISMGGTDPDLLQVSELLKSLNQPIFAGMILGGGFIVGLFISGMNMLGTSAISREGNNLYFMKYIPLALSEQFLIKYAFAAIVGIVSVLPGVIPICVAASLSPLSFLLVCLAAIAGALLAPAIGLLFDVNSPYLNWDVDYKAVKQNINFLWWSLVAIALTVGSVAFMQIPNLPFWVSALMFVLLPLILLVIVFYFIFKLGKKSFARLI